MNATEHQSQPGSGPEDLSGPEARLPHERGQSVDTTHGEPDAQMEQAAATRDVACKAPAAGTG